MEKVAVVILAGGQGKRMRSDTPKVLISTREKPIIFHVLSLAKELSTERIVVVTGYKANEVESAIVKELSSIGINSSAVTFCQQKEPKGTGDAARTALPGLAGFKGTVLFLYGDVPLIRKETLLSLLETHEKENATMTVLSFVPHDTKAYGRLIRDKKTGALLRITEAKDCSPEELQIKEANSGIYAVDSAFLAPALKGLTNDNAQGEFYLTDIVHTAAKEGQRIAVFQAPDPIEMEGVNSVEDLALVNKALLDRIRKKFLSDGVLLEDPATFYADTSVSIAAGVKIGPSVHLYGETTIASGVVIEGHAYLKNVTIGAGAYLKFSVRAEDSAIGEKGVIGPFAHLRPGSKLSEGVHIGNFVETKNAELSAGVKANHLTYLGDCSVGEKTNIGAGTITCNYDGYTKSKTTIGKEVFVGSDTCFIAPVTINDGASIGAGSVISKEVPKDALAFTRAPLTIKEGWSSQKKKRAAQGKA